MSGLKNNIVLAARALAVVSICIVILLSYVYLKDTGVDFKGCVRLRYNWEYVLADRPKYDHPYNGKLFSFSYLTLHNEDPLRVFETAQGGYMFGELFDMEWYYKIPPPIKSELAAYLSSTDGTSWVPSTEFEKQLFALVGKFSVSKVEKIKLKDGTPAAILIVKAKMDGWRGNYRYLVSVSPNGTVVKVKNIMGAAISYGKDKSRDNSLQEAHAALLLPHVFPNAARDRRSICIFKRLIETFEFKGN